MMNSKTNLTNIDDCSNIMIDVKNVSMKFNLGIEKGFSIKQWFVDLGKHKKKRKNESRKWKKKRSKTQCYILVKVVFITYKQVKLSKRMK